MRKSDESETKNFSAVFRPPSHPRPSVPPSFRHKWLVEVKLEAQATQAFLRTFDPSSLGIAPPPRQKHTAATLEASSWVTLDLFLALRRTMDPVTMVGCPSAKAQNVMTSSLSLRHRTGARAMKSVGIHGILHGADMGSRHRC